MEHAVAKSYGDIDNTLMVSCEKFKTVSFASSIMISKNRFPAKLIFHIVFGSAASACCLLKFYCYHLVLVFELTILQQTSSCVIMSLICCNISNTFIYSQIISCWLIRDFSFSHNIIVFYFCNRNIISFVTCFLCFIFK